MSSEAEYVSIVAVGFSPVAQGSSVSSGGVTATPAEGESPLGFIDALLSMLSQGATPGTEAGAEGEAGAGTGTEADVGALASLGLAVDAAIKNDLPATLPEDSKKLLDDLVAALAAIDDAAQSGKPIDPALHEKLSETLDEIAGMLGIAMPQEQVVTLPTAIAAAGQTAPEVELDAGLPLENKTLPPGYKLPTAAETNAKPDTQLADDFLKAVKQATAPVPVEEEQPADEAAAPKAAEDGETIDPETPIGRLIAKLTEVAEKLETRLPDVSAKLEALGEKLSAKTLDADTLAKLTADLEASDLDTLLAPKPEATAKPATPALFTAPTLPVPEIAALPQKQTTEAPAKTVEPATPANEPELAKPEEPNVAQATKPADRPEAQPKEHDRSSFAQQLSDARAEKIVEQSQSQQPQSPAGSVKTDIGVVTPKSVHAAYQVPVQQINAPQVAFEVVRQFNQGNSRFLIRLDPPELGRIDVRMQVDGDGNVHTRMTVERAETLDLMQRDQRSLEKALAQAGLDSSKTSLEFSLRQNPFARDGQNPQQQGNGSPFSRGDTAGSEAAPEIESTTTTQYRGTASAGGVNLFV